MQVARPWPQYTTFYSFVQKYFAAFITSMSSAANLNGWEAVHDESKEPTWPG